MRDPDGGLLRNLFDIERIGRGISTEIRRDFVEPLFADIVGRIAAIDPTEPKRRTYRDLRLEKLVGEVDSLVGKAHTSIDRRLRARLADLGEVQTGWAELNLGRRLGSATVDLSSAQVGRDYFRAILESDPFEGATLKEWAQDAGDRTSKLVRRQIKIGMAQQEGVPELVRRVRGRSIGGGRYRGGVLDVTTRQAEALVRTGTNYIANRGHRAAYEANSDVLTGMVITAVLDRRTTNKCKALDGRLVPFDDPELEALTPPFHWACRTVLVPRVDWEGLGIEPLEDSDRASEFGPTKGADYEEWLRGKPDAYIDEALGSPTLGKWFREGKLSLPDLLKRDLSVKTIGELREELGLPKVRKAPAVPPPPPPPPAFPSADEIGEKLEAVEADVARKRAALQEEGLAVMNESDELYEAVESLEEGTPEWIKANDRLLELQMRELEIFDKRSAFEGEVAARTRALVKRPVDEQNRVNVSNALRTGRDRIEQGEDLFRSLVHRRWLEGYALSVNRTRSNRAYARQHDRSVHLPANVSPSTVVHEYAHHIEYAHPEVLNAAVAFRTRRGAGEVPSRIPGYGPGEISIRDEFLSPYVGKVYQIPDMNRRGAPPIDRATEVVTMGLEYMAKDPLAFWRKDPDHFRFTWELMNGEVPTP